MALACLYLVAMFTIRFHRSEPVAEKKLSDSDAAQATAQAQYADL